MLLSCYEFQLILRHFWNESNTVRDLPLLSRNSSFCRRAKRYMCAVKSFLGSLKHHSLKPVDSPNAACVRPDGFQQSGPLTIPLMPSSFAYSVGSPNVTCVRPNRFRSTKPSLSYFFTFRETRRGCTQRVSGGRFVRQLLRAPLFRPRECHQTQPT